MPNKYKLTPAARNDIKQIWHYSVDTWGETQAAAFTTQLETRFDEIAENPFLGRARSDVAQGYRSLPCGKHVIFYTISNEIVEIIGIPHASMDVDHRLTDKRE